ANVCSADKKSGNENRITQEGLSLDYHVRLDDDALDGENADSSDVIISRAIHRACPHPNSTIWKIVDKTSKNECYGNEMNILFTGGWAEYCQKGAMRRFGNKAFCYTMGINTSRTSFFLPKYLISAHPGAAYSDVQLGQ
ncbi:15204_t:CDS:2, partial [Acaulospora morrowiae]